MDRKPARMSLWCRLGFQSWVDLSDDNHVRRICNDCLRAEVFHKEPCGTGAGWLLENQLHYLLTNRSEER